MRSNRGIEVATRGFTLIELMIAVAVIAILAAIAIPNYNDYIRRSQLQEAFTNLSDYRIRMEQYYQDNRSYAAGGACGAANPGTAKYFGYACVLNTTGGAPAGQSYTMTATALVTVAAAGAVFTINEKNVKATVALPSEWTGTMPADAGSRWVDKAP